MSEDEINSGVGLFIARSKRVPCTRDANVNKFKSKERATILGGSRVWDVLFMILFNSKSLFRERKVKI